MQNYIIETTPRGVTTPVKTFCVHGTKDQILDLIDTDPRLQDKSVWYAPAPRTVVGDYPDSFREAKGSPGVLIPLKAFKSSAYQVKWSELIMPVVAAGLVLGIAKVILD